MNAPDKSSQRVLEVGKTAELPTSIKIVTVATLVLVLGVFASTRVPRASAPEDGSGLSEQPDPRNAVFSAPSIGLALDYPLEWILQADRRDLGKAAFLDLKFSVPAQDGTAQGEFAEIVIRRTEIDDGTSLEKWIRESLDDSRKLLTLAKCQYPTRALECIEVTDQTRFASAGRTPSELTVFLRTPGYVYGVGWGKDNTFDHQGTHGRQLVQSFRFGEK